MKSNRLRTTDLPTVKVPTPEPQIRPQIKEALEKLLPTLTPDEYQYLVQRVTQTLQEEGLKNASNSQPTVASILVRPDDE